MSIGIDLLDLRIDLVPGRMQNSFGGDHSLYLSRRDTWQKTNVQTHIHTIRGSRHRDVIRLAKHWRNLHGLDFSSFAVELAVIKALDGAWEVDLATRLLKVLRFFKERITLVAL